MAKHRANTDKPSMKYLEFPCHNGTYRSSVDLDPTVLDGFLGFASWDNYEIGNSHAYLDRDGVVMLVKYLEDWLDSQPSD